MEYQTMIILAQTVIGCLFLTVGIMYCFFDEAKKEKQDQKDQETNKIAKDESWTQTWTSLLL